MREHEVNQLNNFIMGWYIEPEVCNHILTVFYDESTVRYPGRSSDPNGPSPEIKESIDAPILPGFSGLNPYWHALQNCLNLYTEKYPHSQGLRGYSLKEEINIQHYPIGGGFKIWHCERASADEIIRDRHLVFMTYLNNVDDGGTEFYYQKLKIKAEKGLTLIWPADWTHTHKGQISNTKEKTIITGWISYK